MKDYNKLVDGYFEGTLSEAEEREMKDFLASPEGSGHEYDEARAVAGYFAVGRDVHREAIVGRESGKRGEGAVGGSWVQGVGRQGGRRGWRPLYSGIAAAAACLVAAIGIAAGIYGRENYCVTYYKGAKVTDKAVVMGDVESTLAEMVTTGDDVYDQLSDFFDEPE